MNSLIAKSLQCRINHKVCSDKYIYIFPAAPECLADEMLLDKMFCGCFFKDGAWQLTVSGCTNIVAWYEVLGSKIYIQRQLYVIIISMMPLPVREIKQSKQADDITTGF